MLPFPFGWPSRAPSKASLATRLISAIPPVENSAYMSKDSPDFAETRGKTRAQELASPTLFEGLRQSMRALEAAIRELGSSELPVLRLAEAGAIPTEMDVEV